MLLLTVAGVAAGASAPKPAATPTARSAARSATTPFPGPTRIIGGPAIGGCIAGAVRLPDDGPGFQTIHASHASFWGAPRTIAGIAELGREAAAAGLPTLLVEDISNPRGGPMPGGHVSHQIGLDADVALDMRPRPPLGADQREIFPLASLVQANQRETEPELWTSNVVTVLRLAATLPGVDRMLVNPAIKRQLCNTLTGDRSWLRLIRPWYGHAAHMHISFRCPDDQPECHPMAPPPAGDGCDATLQWWFDRLDAPPGKPGPPPKPHPPPPACRAILGP